MFIKGVVKIWCEVVAGVRIYTWCRWYVVDGIVIGGYVIGVIGRLFAYDMIWLKGG
jgi:hypothetical protein